MGPGGPRGRACAPRRAVAGDAHGVRRCAGPYAALVVGLWLTRNWSEFDGWCSARGIDAAALPADRGFNLYLWAIREHADDERRAAIDRALEPPVTMRVDNRPAWFGSDEEVWSEWQTQARS